MLLRQASFAFLLGSILCAQSTPAAVEIRVRALDYRTGHPLKDHRIAMWLSDSAGHIQYHKSEKLIQTTGKNGYAVFRIKEPLPPSVMIDTDSLPDLNCSATSELATGAVLQDGIVGQEKSDAKCTRKRPPPATSAVPGEVVIYVHQLGLFDRLHRLFY